jgi:tetratricopeptide (TPR) repeat protein
MIRRDARGLPLSTASGVARDAYVEGVARLLFAQPGIEAAFGRALEADPGFALAHVGLARAHQLHGRGAEARASIGRAAALAAGLDDRERSHVGALGRVVAGDAAGAMTAVRAHLADWPRDAMVLAPATGVFGLFGFSGRAGREAALAAFLDDLAPAYGEDDAWFLAARAFAACETGRLDAARVGIERSLELAPANANAAHVRAHVHHESGEHVAGFGWLRDWCASYPRAGAMHCHLHWHLALGALAAGDLDAANALFDDAIAPQAAWGPPLNLISDGASFLLRAELAGAPRRPEAWRAVARAAQEAFPATAGAFADAHVAMAAALAGDAGTVARVRAGANGPAADLVRALSDAFEAFAAGEPAAVLRALESVAADHERLGGSRAQRELVALMRRHAGARHRGA